MDGAVVSSAAVCLKSSIEVASIAELREAREDLAERVALDMSLVSCEFVDSLVRRIVRPVDHRVSIGSPSRKAGLAIEILCPIFPSVHAVSSDSHQ
jgi:hypothetical protein